MKKRKVEQRPDGSAAITYPDGTHALQLPIPGTAPPPKPSRPDEGESPDVQRRRYFDSIIVKREKE